MYDNAIASKKKEFLLLNSKFEIRKSELYEPTVFVIPSVLYTYEQ